MEDNTKILAQNQNTALFKVVQGFGIIKYTNGKVLKANFKDGLAEGYGIEINEDGDIYKGEFSHGLKNGFGMLTTSDGSTFTGEWVNNKLNGIGIHDSNCFGIEHYEGTWKNGMPEGTGRKIIIKENIKETYEGTLKRNKAEGYGIHKETKIHIQMKTEQNEDVSLIQVAKDKLISTYEGQYKNNQKNGYGELKEEDFSYKGNWLKDKKYGYGILTKPNGYEYKGYFINDCKEGYGKEKCPNIPDETGNIPGSFEGFFRNGIRYHGTKTLPNGEKYTGYFRNNIIKDKGLLTYPNGETYEGEFKDGVPDGEGTETLLIEERGGIKTFKEFNTIVKGKTKLRADAEQIYPLKRDFYFDNKLIYKGKIEKINRQMIFKITEDEINADGSAYLLSKLVDVKKLLKIGASKLLKTETFGEVTKEKIFGTVCSICQNDFLNGNEVLLSKCKGENSKCHAFHLKCGIQLFINNEKCPICRRVVYDSPIVRDANFNALHINDDDDLDLYS